MSVFSATKQGSVDISFCTLLVSSILSASSLQLLRRTETDNPQAYHSFCAVPSCQNPRSPKAARGCRVTMRLGASDQDVVDGDVDCEREKIC
jgi:hypothetical protein